MTALGDTIYILGVLIPLFALIVRNYLVQLVGFIFGTVGFLAFVTNLTDITFSGSTFYLAFIPLAMGLLCFAMFFNWLREERL
ncbi:hypothetical protein SMF1_0004 [Sulfolobales Mexican fusellovirus 1]|uniref:hypothetical protein n=1 Tax=Sulfolobales Mexican fusellovirus 1 TaxID=1298531 RepID=UPI0002C15CCA|nr:hypothetical protein SMF1_0004 [Sulfolobales Mexican fusellovirus 1]AGG36551.1 hypothetical protein SMF1_0004 [Sulfolobales Mexican fusellovirus 1]